MLPNDKQYKDHLSICSNSITIKINVAEFFVYDFSHSNNSINIQQALASKERKGQGTNKKNQGINT